MKWLIRHILPSVFSSIKSEGYREAINDILVFKDKIYTEPVTLYGNGHSITNCSFLGNEWGLKVELSDFPND